jgi:hypothetical protein
VNKYIEKKKILRKIQGPSRLKEYIEENLGSSPPSSVLNPLKTLDHVVQTRTHARHYRETYNLGAGHIGSSPEEEHWVVPLY